MPVGGVRGQLRAGAVESVLADGRNGDAEVGDPQAEIGTDDTDLSFSARMVIVIGIRNIALVFKSLCYMQGRISVGNIPAGILERSPQNPGVPTVQRA